MGNQQIWDFNNHIIKLLKSMNRVAISCYRAVSAGGYCGMSGTWWAPPCTSPETDPTVFGGSIETTISICYVWATACGFDYINIISRIIYYK